MHSQPLSIWIVGGDAPTVAAFENARYHRCDAATVLEELSTAGVLPDVLLIHGWDGALAARIEPLPRVWVDVRPLPRSEIRLVPNAAPEATADALITAMNLAATRTLRATVDARHDADVHPFRAEAPSLPDFALHFQPMWSIDGRDFIGAEALLRWHGLDVPGLRAEAIISRAEARGEIARVGDWVFERAAWQLVEWGGRWPADARIALNVTASQLEDPGLPERVDQVCALYRVGTDRFELELPYAALHSLDRRHFAALDALCDAGLGLTLDRLGGIRMDPRLVDRLPASTWKLDRALVARTADAGACTLIAALTDLAHHVGIRTIAVGVESTDQQHRLAELGCDGIQGFLLAEPLPPAEMAALLVAHRERRATFGRSRVA